MYTHERCHRCRYGKNGRLNNPKSWYCFEGLTYDSQTGKATDSPRCIDWFRSCYRLKPIKVQ